MQCFATSRADTEDTRWSVSGLVQTLICMIKGPSNIKNVFNKKLYIFYRFLNRDCCRHWCTKFHFLHWGGLISSSPTGDEFKVFQLQMGTTTGEGDSLVSAQPALATWQLQPGISASLDAIYRVPRPTGVGSVIQSTRSGFGSGWKRSSSGASSQKTYPCIVCGMTFFSHSSCARHKWTHQDRSRFRHACPHCPKKFYRKDYLTKHVRAIHSSTEEYLARHGRVTHSTAGQPK